MSIVAKSASTFSTRGMYKGKTAHAFEYLSERTTFWVAVMSLLAFVTGNMLGQHGWHVFWASVLGSEPVIAFDGAVPPLPGVPDYGRWAAFGGNVREHTYRQLPRDFLLPFPTYDAQSPDERYFVVDSLGTYATGRGEGSHPGVDIASPIGTPVLSVANGIVTRVGTDAGGYGTHVVIKHPGVPDPDRPSATTTLYSVYGHLESVLISEGDAVKKGAQIGTIGMTGFTTGPHLHFQMDREEAPWHPYWPFSGTEARESGYTMTQAVNAGFHRERGLQYTVHPLLFVQRFPSGSVMAKKSTAPAAQASRSSVSAQQTRADRITQRKAKYAAQTPVAAAPTMSSPSASSAAPQVVAMADTTIAAAVPAAPMPFTSILIRHDGSFTGREREKITITLLDADGHAVTSPTFSRTLDLRTAFGKAQFFPPSLPASAFVNGKAQVEMLPFGQQTVVIQVQPTAALSQPMVYEK